MRSKTFSVKNKQHRKEICNFGFSVGNDEAERQMQSFLTTFWATVEVMGSWAMILGQSMSCLHGSVGKITVRGFPYCYHFPFLFVFLIHLNSFYGLAELKVITLSRGMGERTVHSSA